MPVFNNALIGASGQAGAAGYAIERSLRFNSADSAYLNRTPSSAGNRKTWTWSGWVKRTDEGSFEPLFSAGNNPWVHIAFRNGKFDCILDAGVGNLGAFTDAIYRDQSAWYHLVLAVDTTQSTAADRIKFYVNGVEVDKTADIGGYPSQNYDTLVNSTIAHRIGADGRVTGGGIRHCDCYMADVHFIDGQALTAADFGEYDDNGVWQPKAYAGSHGTNGFKLDFSDNSSAAALGTDQSTNNNDWTVNNLSVTQATYFTFNNLSGGSAAALIDGTLSYTDATFDPVNGAYIDTDISIYGLSAGDTINVRYWNAAHAAGQTCTATFSQHDSSGTLLQTVATQTWDQGQEWNDSSGYVAITLASGFHSIRVTLSNNSTSNPWGIGEMEIQGITLITDSSNDSLFDSPTNGTQEDTGLGGEVSGNYCTLNPLNKSTGTLSNGNLDYSISAVGSCRGSMMVSSGKWYFEVNLTASGNPYVGIAGVGQAVSGGAGYVAPNAIAANNGGSIYYRYGGSTTYPGNTVSIGTGVIGIAIDVDSKKIWWSKNGTWYKFDASTANLTTTISEVEAGNFSTSFSNLEGDFFTVHLGNSTTNNTTYEFNAGQRAFAYTAPSGFKALNTANLSDPTLADGSDYMDVVTYSGNGSTQTISGLEFSPDFVWVKNRSTNRNHYVYDAIRGAGTAGDLAPNTTDAEDNLNTGLYGYLSAFTSDGFTVVSGTDSTNNFNSSGQSYVGWAWDAGHPATAATGAVSFDGTGDYLSLPASSDFNFGSGDFTIEFFWYPTSTSRQALYHGSFGADYSIGIDYNSVGTNKLGFWASSNGTTWDIVNADGGGSGITTGEPIQNAWNHIAFVRNGNSLTMYLNGGSVGSITSTATISLADTDTPVIGAWWNSNTAMSDVHGSISNFRILKGTALYTSNYTPPTAELTNVTNTKLLCCQSTTSANAATVSPTLSGINANVFWSSLVSAPSGYYDQAHQAGWLFNGDTSGNSDILPAEGDKWTVSHNFGSVSTLEFFTYYPGGITSNGANAFEVNGSTVTPISKTNAGWTSLPIAGGTLTSFGNKNTSISGQDYCFVSAIRVDGTILLDSIGLHGDASATTFNPLDAFSVNGTGYATASAAGITEGTIALTGASVNRSAGFSIVSYTGTGAAGTIGHGLNSAPEMIIGKNRGNSTSWIVGAAAVNDWSKVLLLNSTAALATNGNFNNTAPTSSVFSVGTGSGLNQIAKEHIAYCFAPVEGYSSFGSYIGNGSTDGPFVYTGMRPRFVLTKASSAGGNWQIIDSTRSDYNLAGDKLWPSQSYEENSATLGGAGADNIDILSNGFKLKTANNGTNGSGVTYIYAAFAENPFKYARAR